MELLSADSAEDFFRQAEIIPRTEYPLRQLALFARLHHKLGEQLSADEKLRLTAYLHAEYLEVGRHYVRFAKALDAALRKRGEEGITDDWDAYEADYMQTYTAKLDEKRPPGWGKP